MGLDIIAYSNTEFKEIIVDYDEFEEKYGWERNFYRAYHMKAWPAMYEGVKDCGVYSYEDERHFRAGSYSGYNRWRAWLSETFIGASPDLVWANPTAYEDNTFSYLVNFSDCEGIIGPVMCKRLYEAFEANLGRAAENQGEDGEYYEIYVDFMKAFKFAENGFLVYC